MRLPDEFVSNGKTKLDLENDCCMVEVNNIGLSDFQKLKKAREATKSWPDAGVRMRANKVMYDIINMCRHSADCSEHDFISEESQQMTKMLECQRFLLTWPTKSLNNVLLLKQLNSRI